MSSARPFIPTLKEAPPDVASKSLALLLRGGYVRRAPQGTLTLLPLGLRVLRKLEEHARHTLQAFALEVRTSRSSLHERQLLDLAHELRSFRELPRVFFELGSTLGSTLMVTSFDADPALADARRVEMLVMCTLLGQAAGVELLAAHGAPRSRAEGTRNELYAVLPGNAEAAKLDLCVCTVCEHVSTADAAVGRVPAVAPGEEGSGTPHRVHTPAQRTIAQLSAFLQLPATRILKSIVFMAGDAPILAVVRGDHEVNPTHVAQAANADVTLATPEEVRRATAADVGFAGPVGFKGRVFVDHAAAVVQGAAVGANQTEYHLTNVTFGRDFQGERVDLRRASPSDTCGRCGNGMLQAARGLGCGSVVVTALEHAGPSHPVYTDASQKRRPLAVTSLSFDLYQLLFAIVETHHDESGIVWPVAVAPYAVHVITIGKEDAVMAAASNVRGALVAAGLPVLVDDRDERPGAKFKDADLVGAPFRITIGQKSLDRGGVELRPRTEQDPGNAELVPVDQVVARLLSLAPMLGRT